jgi:UDP-N-acetylmuramoyl-tripeptide--D-alanyl-D-alanine ligase
VSVLWTSDEIAAATGGTASARFEVTGVTFDSREVQSGDLFVAMPGTVHDGHKFVDDAFAAGAAGAIVSQPVNGPHILVDDTNAAARRSSESPAPLGKPALRKRSTRRSNATGRAGSTARSRATTTTRACR